MFKKILLSAALLLLCVAPLCAQTLKVAVCAGWPPLEFYDENGAMNGLSVDYARALAKAMKMEMQLVDCQWNQVFTGLLNRDYDMVVSSISITQERATMLNFSNKYMSVQLALLVKQGGEPVKFSNISGKQLGVRQYTTSYYAGKSSGAKINYYVELAEAMDALLNGQVEAVLCDSPVAYYYANVNPQFKGQLSISDLDSVSEDYGVALRKEDQLLLRKVNQAIADLQEDGTMKRLQDKWMGIAPCPVICY